MSWETSTDLLAMIDACGGANGLVNGSTVKGLLDRDYVESQGVETFSPTFTCRTQDLSGVGHGVSVEVSGTSYTVRGVQNDGTGITVLVLSQP